MAIESGQTTKLSFKQEGTGGSNYNSAASGDYTIIPFKSTSLALTKTNHESGIITGDREVQDVIIGSHQVAGDIAFDLSHQTAFTEMFKAILGDFTLSSGAVSVGSTRSSYTIHQAFTTLAESNDNHIFKGCEFNSFAMTIPADGLIDCSVGVIGAAMATVDNEGDGTEAGFTDTNDPFHSSDVTITEGAADSICTDLSLNIDNGLSTTNRIGSNTPIQGGIGKCRVTGSMTCHFSSDHLLQKFINDTESALTISMGSGATGYSFILPRIKYTAGSVEVGGEGLLSVAMEFSALYKDSDNSSSITIDTDLS